MKLMKPGVVHAGAQSHSWFTGTLRVIVNVVIMNILIVCVVSE